MQLIIIIIIFLNIIIIITQFLTRHMSVKVWRNRRRLYDYINSQVTNN